MASQRFPKLAEKLLGWFIKDELLEELLGDLQEYHHELISFPLWRRIPLFWFHLISCLRPILLRKFFPSRESGLLSLLRFQIRFNLRVMAKNRASTTFSFLTIVIGILGFFLTFSWVENEASMDKFHANGDRIGIGVARLTPESNLIALSVSRLFQIDYQEHPEIEKVMFIHTYMPGEIELVANHVSYGGKGLVVDSTFFDFFDFKVSRGAYDALADPSNIIITQEYAEKVFGTNDPLDQLVHINCDQEGTFRVAAIVERIPSNSSLTFDFLIPRHSKTFWRRAPQDIILLKNAQTLSSLNAKIKEHGAKSERFPNSEVYFYPFEQIYRDHPINISLFSAYGNSGNLKTVKFIALALLLITVICFTNLQFAVQSNELTKAKLKHIIGANKSHLLGEWMVRGLMLFLVTFCITLAIYHWLFPSLVSYLSLRLDEDLAVAAKIIGVTAFGTIVLSTFIASSNLLSNIRKPGLLPQNPIGSIGPSRKVFAVFQYALTIVLIIGTIVITSQLRYLLAKDLGIQQSEIVSSKFFDIIPNARQDSVKRAKIIQQHQSVMQRLRQHPDITGVSQGILPFDYAYDLPFKIAGSSEDFIPIKTLNADPGFAQVFDLQIVEGRFFDEHDENNDFKVVINESAKAFFGIEIIEDARLIYKVNNTPYQVIGVVEDFHFEHLSQEIKPLILPYYTRMDNEIMIRYRKGTDKTTIQFVEALYEEVNPEGIFSAPFFSDTIADQYANEEKVRKLYTIFGTVALILSTVTLFSFVYQESKRRTKEVGIRKVNGASPRDILALFSVSFLKTIFIALLIAVPIGWYLMSLWLGNFSNRVDQGVATYLLIISLILLWCLSAIGWHALKIARLNPVESLRYE